VLLEEQAEYCHDIKYVILPALQVTQEVLFYADYQVLSLEGPTISSSINLNHIVDYFCWFRII
jgi:hypothetical protein